MSEELVISLENPTKTICEIKRKFEVEGGKREYRWVLIKVSDIPGRPTDIRCPYCHGSIHLEFEQNDSGHRDHFEHNANGGRYHCRAGNGFPKGGEHKMSSKPVV